MQPALSPAQLAFLRIHAAPVEAWRWHFLGTQLRATGPHGACTLGRGELEALVALDLMAWSHGVSVELTARGAEAALSEEEEVA